MLRRIRKKITLDQVRQAVRLCNEAGMLAHTSFMVGLPGESPETLEETKQFAASLGSLYGYHFLAPFPGTTVREEVDQYDLEILTDDWSRYDANSAIVRTSSLSPEQINAFVGEFEGIINECWKKQVLGYYDKTNTPVEDLQVEGYFKTRFVYRLLSEDLIESLGEIPAADASPEPGEIINASIDRLCRRLHEATDADESLLRRTIRLFIDKGYIKGRQNGKSLIWSWTHNNRLG
jgi:hypothetical protein